MAGPPTAEHGQITIVFGGPALPTAGVCTMGVQTEGITLSAGVLLPLTDIFEDFHGEMSTAAVVMTRIELKRGPSETGPSWARGINIPGHAPGECIPPNTAVLVRKELADISGRFAGRMYWPGYSESAVGNDGTITNASMGFISSACTKLFTDLQALNLNPVVFGGPSSIGGASSVVALTPQSRVATQRRRLRR